MLIKYYRNLDCVTNKRPDYPRVVFYFSSSTIFKKAQNILYSDIPIMDFYCRKSSSNHQSIIM